MTAQEWLDALQTKTEAATPGPWYAGQVLERGTVRGKGVVIDCRMTPDDDNFGVRVGREDHSVAAFIAAANPETVKRLIAMIRFLALGCDCDAEPCMYGYCAPTCLLEKAYKATEPKE